MEESIPVKVGEDTVDSTPDSELAAPTLTLLSSSSDNVPEDLRPALQGGLTDNAVVPIVLTDLLLDLDISGCKFTNAR